MAPADRAILDTFELYHPVLAEAVRVVHNFEDIDATLEADAPREAGEEVNFIACAVRTTRSEESDTAASPEITLQVDNVSGIMSDALKMSRESLEPWELIHRIYCDDDFTGPAIVPPLRLQVLTVDVTTTTVTLHCQYADFVNTAVPVATFKLSEYPGLDQK